MREDPGCHGIRAEVLVALAFETMREVDHRGAGACDLEGGVDGPVARSLDVFTCPRRRNEVVERYRVELDQLFGAQANLLGVLVDRIRVAQRRGPQGNFLEERGRRCQHGGSSCATRGRRLT